MNEQLRPVDGRQERRAAETEEERAAARAIHTTIPETDLLTQVMEIVRKAQVEFACGHDIAGRLEITHAQRLLDRVFHGEVV